MAQHRCHRARKVLLVAGTGAGFISQYSHAVAIGLVKCGVEVKLITGREDEFHGVSIPVVKDACLRRGLRGWLALTRQVLTWRPDIVHFQWVERPCLGLPFVRYWQRHGIRVLYTPHNILPHSARWLCMLGYRVWYRHMDAIVARDRHIAWALEEVLDVPRERVVLMPENPNLLAELPVEKSPVPDLPEREAGEIRLLVFGHGGRGKGLAELCKALLSGDVSSELHLVVAGERATAGVPRDALDRLAARMRVTVLDRYIDARQVPSLFAEADLLVLPYLKVCKSPLLDLAAEFGVPVLRSDRVHAARFDENVHGVTVAHGDVTALGTALDRLVEQRQHLSGLLRGDHARVVLDRDLQPTGIEQYEERDALEGAVGRADFD